MYIYILSVGRCTELKNENREIKGLAIMSLESFIKRINKLHYKVKSQSSSSEKETWYDIIKKVRTQQRWASKRRMDLYLSRLHISTSTMQTHLCSYIFETTSKENSFPRCCSVVHSSNNT